MANKVNSICKSVLRLTEEDFNEVEVTIKEQEEYFHPLKMGTAHRIHSMAEYNRNVLAKIRELKKTIEDGKEVAKSL